MEWGTRAAFLPETEGPNLRGHNHAILAVKLPDSPHHFLDSTCRTCGFDDLPWGDQGTQVVVAGEERGLLVRTPLSAPDRNRWTREYDVALSADGRAQIRMAYSASGQIAQRSRAALYVMNDEERETWIRRKTGRRDSVTVTRSSIGHRENFDVPLTLEVEGSIGRMARGSGDLWTLGVGNFLRPPMSKIPKDRPALPAHLGIPYSSKMVARVTLPEGLRVGSNPDPVVIESPIGRYERTYVVESGVLTITRAFTRKVPIVEVEALSELRDFAEKVRAADGDTVVLTRG